MLGGKIRTEGSEVGRGGGEEDKAADAERGRKGYTAVISDRPLLFPSSAASLPRPHFLHIRGPSPSAQVGPGVFPPSITQFTKASSHLELVSPLEVELFC